MKIKAKIVFLLVIVFIYSGTGGCGSSKYAQQRINLMMPKKSEMANNEKYKEVTKRKTNKVKVKKAKRKSLF